MFNVAQRLPQLEMESLAVDLVRFRLEDDLALVAFELPECVVVGCGVRLFDRLLAKTRSRLDLFSVTEKDLNRPRGFFGVPENIRAERAKFRGADLRKRSSQ
jgi:hypothetical protein